MDVYIDDNHLESFAGDGIIVSTPSGSTAYNFSAGGSVLYHGLDGFQVTPLAPINSKAYRSLLNSLVVPSKSNVTLYFRDHNFDRKSSIVLADGLNRSYDNVCLLYTSDAADDTPCVDLGGRRIIKKKK